MVRYEILAWRSEEWLTRFLRRLSNHHCCNELLTNVDARMGPFDQVEAMLVRISWVALSVDEGSSFEQSV
jgi:hypothetical protein